MDDPALMLQDEATELFKHVRSLLNDFEKSPDDTKILKKLGKGFHSIKVLCTLLAIPIVNVYGFVSRTRYLPDRRDLNRSFPGSERGSMAARLAELFLKEIVDKCHYGIDLHTAAVHRQNLPQIRANLDDPETARIAHAFHVPVLLNSNIRDGSLRQVAADRGIPILLYEAGEALRFDEHSIRAGVKGIVGEQVDCEAA